MRRPIALIVPSLLLLAAGLMTNAAVAVKPVGDCPSDYKLLTKDQVALLEDANLALPAFYAVDLNGDELVCYMAYPHGPQPSGHYGNFIDNTAGQHK